MAGADTEGRWGDLLTDGHVRAARLNFMQPWLVGLAFALLALGSCMSMSIRAVDVAPRTDNATQRVSSLVEREQRPVLDALAGLPALEMTSERAADLPRASELPEVARMALAGLDRSDDLPAELPLARLQPSDFWAQPWPHAQLATTRAEDVVLLGAVANNGSYYVEPVRWIGVFRKKDGRWAMASLSDSGFVRLPEGASVRAVEIPRTLRPVLPNAGEAG